MIALLSTEHRQPPIPRSRRQGSQAAQAFSDCPRLHWARNALSRVGTKHRGAVSAMLKTVFAQDNEVAAVDQWGEVADALRARDSKLGETVGASREDVLA